MIDKMRAIRGEMADRYHHNVIKQSDYWEGFTAAHDLLMKQVEPLVEALKRECCCTGERTYDVLIMCDACEAIEAWQKDFE